MDKGLAGQVCLVTGGSRGIGAEVCRALALEGVKVAVNYHNSEAAALKLLEEIRLQGMEAMAVKADISQAAQVEAMFQRVEKELGPVGLLVNNAGISLQAMLVDTAEDEWDRLMGVNLKGAFLCCRRALPGMLSNSKGSIVNVASVWGMRGAACESVYAASKGGLLALTRSLAVEVGQCGIRVNAIAPGPVKTDMLVKELQADEIEQLNSEIPLGRLGRSREMAAACVFLLSSQASYINGAVLNVDGGWKA
ncbi:elongation factor P 5-aminopentanone reductase [Syntrophomonas palmitatica]|uniref:elongation factor P 5-aminopentanone reductase n=1 Tax=Syntrophomonas palmitatica TaxID=402877 RepID=UPI0009F8BA5B|nr:3-oxoacyl-ACP reductase FabG [Syntrophomonas palmitatica]